MKKIAVALGLISLVLLVFFVFAPAFQGKITINPVIELHFFSVRWYGLILASAILISYFFARKNSWRFGISKEDIDDYSFWLVIVGMLGARVYYVIFNLEYYIQNFGEIYKIWHGGLSIYGGILAGIAYTYFYIRKKAYDFWQLFDLVALSLPLGQAFGRIGNFINQEAYGTVTDLPWKMYVASDNSYHHPAFLYEALYDIFVFVILYKFIGRIGKGTIGLMYLLLYSLGRFFIEAIRTDSFIINGFRVDQVVAFVIIIVSGFLILRRFQLRKAN